MKKILTVIGARPQFIKASVVSLALKNQQHFDELIVHTGQHFDKNMSSVFFDELKIPTPAFQLDIHGGSHGEMTARMLIELEKIILNVKPDFLMVYGDTNSTLAGALAAAKLHIAVIHVEAGLRSFNRKMPEEINRILTDQLSDKLFCPTQVSVDNLIKEGFGAKATQIHLVGDVMQDSAMYFSDFAQPPMQVKLHSNFVLATLHRAENTDSFERLNNIVNAINSIHSEIMPVILPIHPRTLRAIEKFGIHIKAEVVDPLSYFEMLWSLQHCSLVLTDSGGAQKEAFFFDKPCVTMRDQTEWIELVETGVNVLAGADKFQIIQAVSNMLNKKIFFNPHLYGGGQASFRIVEKILE